MPQISRAQPLRPPKMPLRRIGAARKTSLRREPSSTRGQPRLASVVIGLLLCLAGVLVYMWPRVHIVRLGYRVQTLEQRSRGLMQEREQLRLEIASLKDPQRVYQIATDRLGMIVPRHEQVFSVLHGRKVR